MKTEVVLTVAESKRLIAKGVVALDYVQDKMEQGIIILGVGSTNAYIYEELLGTTIDKRAYMAGRTVPVKGAPRWDVQRLPDLVLVDGQPAPELDVSAALERMKPGDVFIKGANALNYGAGVAGVTIGNPTGGTVARAIGRVVGSRLRLLIPVGLEKEIFFSIEDAAAYLAEPDEHLGKVNTLWPIRGDIFTELEALHLLCGVDAIPVAAGGLAGAEGSIRFLLMGVDEAVRDAVELVESIQGEPPIQ